MPSERTQRRIDSLLDEAEGAMSRREWDEVAEKARAVLAMDPENEDAPALLRAAEANLGTSSSIERSPSPNAPPPRPSLEQPASYGDGRYLVRRFLGEGGKKKVYLAHDDLLDRDVAFALIKTENFDEAARARITREAQAMGRLGDHPHIVSIYDIGTEPVSGQPYLVLPLMPGGDVEGLLEQAENHRLPFAEGVRITDELCHALEFAHARGIVHRDIKPGNVWLSEAPSAGSGPAVVKLGDFGLAVAMDRSRLTMAGMMVGTVSYMPPEQATGGEVTARSDLYSVGAMLYELVTGRPPFLGDDHVAIIGQHLNTPPVAPSWHRPDCPPGLEALTLRLLEKDPAKRPSSASEVRQALAAVEHTLRASSVHDGGSTPPAPAQENPVYRRTFVGREAELRQLQAAFDGVLSGQGALAMVVGEPGIGKTALCEQLATYVALRGGRTLVGHCYEEGSLSLPYLAFVEALRTYVLAREPDALRDELGTGAADVARIVSEVRDRAQVELRPPGDPEDDRWRLLQAVSGFLRNAAAVQPLLVVLEDLHWADRGTLDLLLHVSRNLAGARLMVVGSYRDVEVDRAHPLSATLAELSRVTTFSRVRLRGLTAEEVQRMLSALATQDVSWALAEAVHRQTEGHPLFIQEVLRYLVEEGLLAREEGRWRRTGDQPLALAIPEGLRDVIGKRLSRLSAEANRLLAVAAVIGRDFRLETLRALAGLDEEPLLAALEEAVKAGVLEERPQVGGVQYRFAHAFFRQTLYEELSAPRRLRLHQDVARALESQYAARREDHAAELAEHFANSTDRADLAKAVEYGELAAQRAMSVFDYGEAARLLDHALDVQEVLDPDDRLKRCDLLLALGEALGPAGEALRVYEQVAEEAFSLAEAGDDIERLMRACRIALWEGLMRAGGPALFGTPIHRQWAKRADQYAKLGTADRVLADMALRSVLNSEGRLGPGRALAMRALGQAREIGDRALLFQAAQPILGVDDAPQHQEERLALAHEVVSWPSEGVALRYFVGPLVFSASTFLCWGRLDEAEEAWARVRAIAERTRDPLPQLHSLRNGEGIPRVLRGDLDGAIEVGNQLVEQGREAGAVPVSRLYAIHVMFRSWLWMGHWQRILERAEYAGDVRAEKTMRALAIAHSGDETGGDLLSAELLAWVLESDGEDVATGMLVAMLELAVATGDLRAVTEIADRLATTAGMSLSTTGAVGLTCPARHLGAAAALLGKPEEARAFYRQAIEAAGKIRFRPEIALTRLQVAELLLERYPEARAEALEHLDFAIEEFRAMKMQPSLERALRHKGLLKA